MNKCDTCGTKDGLIQVHGSSLGPMSICSCTQCLTHMAEPEGFFEMTFDMVGPEVAAHVKQLSTWVGGKYLTWSDWLKTKEPD